MSGMVSDTRQRAKTSGKEKVNPAETSIVEKKRNCLTCSRPFASEWVGERVCKRCKGSATWRQG